MTDTEGTTGWSAEAPAPPAASTAMSAPPAPEQQKSKKWIWIALAVAGALLLLCCCAAGSAALLMGGTIGTAVPVFDAAKTNAQERACWSNERTVEGAYQQYVAESFTTDLIPDTPTLLGTLVSEGYLKQEPACPAGGTYTWDPSTYTLTCSIHAHY